MERAAYVGCNLSQRSGARKGINGLSGSKRKDGVGGYKHAVARHLLWISKKQEGARHQCYVKNVHSCSAKHFLYKNHRECGGYGYHPYRSLYRTYHRYQHARYQKAFLYLMAAYLCGDKLDAQAHNICHHDFGKHGKEAVEKRIEKLGCRSHRKITLVAHVIHAKQ